jgi:hypothetical protein
MLDTAEHEPEELQEPAPVEDVNLDQDQGKPSASNHILEFCYNFILFMILDCALGYMSCIEALVA